MNNPAIAVNFRTKTSTQVIKQRDVRILQWHQFVLIRRNPARSIPNDETLLEGLEGLTPQTAPSELIELISDKLVYYAYHYLIENDRRIRSYFQNLHKSLLQELMGYGFSSADFRDVIEAAYDLIKTTRSELDCYQQWLADSQDLGQAYKKISHSYDRFRKLNMPYGEHANRLISFLVGNTPVQFY